MPCRRIDPSFQRAAGHQQDTRQQKVVLRVLLNWVRIIATRCSRLHGKPPLNPHSLRERRDFRPLPGPLVGRAEAGGMDVAQVAEIEQVVIDQSGLSGGAVSPTNPLPPLRVLKAARFALYGGSSCRLQERGELVRHVHLHEVCAGQCCLARVGQ